MKIVKIINFLIAFLDEEYYSLRKMAVYIKNWLLWFKTGWELVIRII